jgi:hypothetical protein
MRLLYPQRKWPVSLASSPIAGTAISVAHKESSIFAHSPTS